MISNYLKSPLSLPKAVLNKIYRASAAHYNNTNSSDIATQYYPAKHKHFHFLNTVLRTIVENPKSSTPFDTLLCEIQKFLNADSCALISITESGNSELISITGDAESELLKEYLNQISIDANYNVLKYRDRNINDLFDIKIIRLSDDNQCQCGILILKISKSNSKQISNAEIESIRDSMSGILSSIQKADMSKRLALHEERSLIARELHDSLAQSLSYLKIQVSRLQSLLKFDSPEEIIDLAAVSGIAEELRTNLNISYKQLRELITTFRLTLNSSNLAQALEDSVEEFENKSSVSFHLDNQLALGDLAVDEEIQVLQIVREAISNVVRHSQASSTEIKLTKLPQDTICITVDDDGVGMKDLQTNKRRHGMIIMQQRAHDLGGNFRVLSSSLGGTQIKVTFTSNNRIRV